MMKFITTLGLLLLLECAFGLATVSAERLVLVTSSRSTLPALTPSEVRKLFLGRPVVKDGVRLEPLRNSTDPILQEVFLQKVVFMSGRAYERQLLSNVFREGGERPGDFNNTDQLLAALQSKTGSLTYMWENSAKSTPGVKVITELWQGSLE